MQKYVRRLVFLFVSTISLSQFSAYTQTVDGQPLRLRVGIYNVGHFNQGRLGGFQGTGNIVNAEVNNWKSWIGQQGLDILAVNEWNRYFDQDSLYNAQNELLDPYYRNVYFGEENRWIFNGLATNFELENIEQKDWDGDYYAVIGDLKVGGKVIKVISTHIPWQKQWHDNSLKGLIALLDQYEYFICMGDMNSNDESQKKFLEAGLNMANGGNMRWFPTASATSSASGHKGKADVNIDNIITSPNIRIMKVEAPKTGLNDLDHLPIMADLIVTW